MREKEINFLTEMLPSELCAKVCNVLHINIKNKESKEPETLKGNLLF